MSSPEGYGSRVCGDWASVRRLTPPCGLRHIPPGRYMGLSLFP